MENGLTSTGGFSPGSVANYTCNDGYVLEGDSRRVCQATGAWTGEEPQCVEGPPSITNVTTDSTTSLSVLWAHSVAGQPTCYYLITYICLANGSNSVYHEKRTLTVPAGNTSVVLSDVELPPGSVHVVVVTAVSGDVSRSSELKYIDISSAVTPALVTVVWNSQTQTSATLEWPRGFCWDYVVICYSLSGKDQILVSLFSRAVLNDLYQETYIAVVICSSFRDGYTVDTYAPILLK
ncbi:CUB and sushi domain-containing protein 2 [Geodia barretti]|nr:CUB and sushi domain-containing protein 2 [Geodia barretti]CAI7993223.1 CUB and sushi domain-containing protein 2 [Geodia barretti]